MPSLRVSGLSFAFNDEHPLLSDVTFHLAPGWTGMVGANGSGKTTLLRLLAGELLPDAGQVAHEPPRPTLWLCGQPVERLAPEVETFATTLSAQACRIRGRLELDPPALERWPTLSPGERKRWQIGAALAAEPDTLLLDEPTNHLDAGARRLLVGALRRFAGIGLVVSHDRALLAELTASTLRLEAAGARLWPGAYAQARSVWLNEEARRREIREAARREKRKLDRQLGATGRERDSAQANRSTGKRMKNPKDSDSRSILASTRADWAEAAIARRVAVTRARVERAEARVDALAVEKPVGRSVFAGHARAPMPWLFGHDGPVLAGGSLPLLEEVHLRLGREDRVRIEGPNGAGKTTLVECLLADSNLPADRVLYLPQELDERRGRELIEELEALAPDERGRVLSFVAALGTEPEQLLATAVPSPGEARKLALAFGLEREVWALVLDEPTNHLDLPSIERLEEALRAWPGALLLVTHDLPFARELTDVVWRISGGRVRAEPDDDRAAPGARSDDSVSGEGRDPW